MRDLVYHIDFELVSFVFALLLYIETYLHYPRHTRKNKIFRSMALLVLISQFFDMLSAVTITYAERLPVWVNVLTNSAFFISGLMLCFLFHHYVLFALVPPNGKKLLFKTNRVVLLLCLLSFLPNAFLGFFFSFADGVYIRGPLYLVIHGVSLWFIASASLTLLVNRNVMKKTQIFSAYFFILCYLTVVIVQTFVLPDVLLVMPAVTAMLIIGTFSLESPDYAQLQKTLSELTETKRELEDANRKYFALAYTDVMTNLGNRAAYYARLERLEQAKDRAETFILIADINAMKHLNDCFGHLVGDDAITRTAKLLRTQFPQKDTCYRIGGDEFIVIVREENEEAFLAAVQRFLDAVHAENEQLTYPLAVAFGYSRLGTQTLQEALTVADRNMYRDKLRIKQEEKTEAAL